jgi:hypothetical protein
MSNDMKLVVRTKSRKAMASKAGFTSSDECEPLMKSMFAFLGLPYEKPFACCWIEIQQEKEKKKTGPLGNRPGVQPTWKPADAYGPNAFILDDTMVERVRLVCAGDFQNVVCALMTDILAGTALAAGGQAKGTCIAG